MTDGGLDITICIPVYNDAASAQLLLQELDRVAATLPHRLRVLFVDDGSTQEEFEALPGPSARIPGVEVLRLRRNLGHQRAIAIGLSSIAARGTADAVVVMDGDGEDAPDTLPALLAAASAAGPHRAVFAERLKRHDGVGFLTGYHAFRWLHRLLVGQDIRIGNFSVLPRGVLARVVGVSEIWNHYAAGVVHARILVERVPVARGRRLAGRSKMNLPALVMHGICALSVWSDVIVARMFLVVVALMVIATAALSLVVASRLIANPFTPGWATVVASTIILVVILLGVVCLLLALFVLGSRSGANFLPHRDWRDYVLPDGEHS
jgi:glycosyltransferase involved in cell wall biosynthesis